MKAKYSIDPERCTGCGKCAEECSEHVNIQGCHHVMPGNPRCSGCYHCYTVCPQGAIQLQEPDEKMAAAGDTVTETALSDLLARRRSIRRFLNKPVEDTLVERLINVARYIPSGGNAHAYEFTVLKGGPIKQELKRELSHIYRKRSRLLNNPILRNLAKPFVNPQIRGFLRSREYGSRMKELIARVCRGEDPFFYQAPIIIVIHARETIPTPKEDCMLAGYNICLVAQTLGLGTCFVTLAQSALNASSRCKAIIGLSSRDNVHAVVILGYPGVKHERIAPKPVKTIHWR